jgi:gliding motility-associated-like protein
VGGSNQHVCAITATLSATTPSAGVGFWSVLSGSASFITTSISSATVAIGTGTNSFLWTVTNGVCPATYDTVFVVADPLPPPAYANKDQTICSKNTTLNATPVSGGSSSWQLISGSGLISNTVTNSTTVDSLAIGKNVFRWTVQIGMCPSSFDEVTIWREVPGNIAFAGNNQQVEIPVAQLSASVPVVGKGYWQVLQGTGVIENDSIAMTKINGLSIGTNQLRWTVTNGTCPTSTSDLLIYLDGLKIPNGFSPNGDGVNDTFVIPGLEYYAPADFSVFNRWGALVYHNAAYRNEWNGGNMNNSLLTDDTYYFTLNISKELNFNGYIIIKAAK